jgi:hypothetical protein
MGNILGKSLAATSKVDPSTFGALFEKTASEIGKGSKPFIRIFGEGSKDLQNVFKSGTGGIQTALSGLEKVIGSLVNFFTGAIVKLAGAFLEGMNVANKMWQQSFQGVDSTMKAFKNQLLAPMANTAMGKVMNSFMDNLITSMMFRFEEGLKWRETRQAAAIQMGTGSPGAGSFASGVTKWNWALGRGPAAEAGAAMAGQGFTNIAVFDKMLGMSKQMGMNMQEAAKELRSYAATGLEASDATKVMETNFRKLQAAAAGTTLPVKEMSGYVTQAATAARFMNVDIGLVGTAMSGLVKQSKELSGFGLDMRIHGQGILKDFTTGGSKMTDAMYSFYGSKGGTESKGVGYDWMAGRYGEKAASSITRTAGGGFSFGGEDVISGNKGMENRLRVQLKVMQDAAAGASDAQEAFFMMKKVGEETLGLSEEAATALAAGGEEGLDKILNNGALSSEFKSTNQIMGELQTSGARTEQLQRLLVSLNMKQLDVALLLPVALEGLGEYIKTGKKDKISTVATSGLDLFGDMFKEGTEVAKLLKGTDPETFNKMQALGKKLTGSVKAKAEGGSVLSGSSYLVGERGPEIFSPESSGNIIPNNQIGGSSGGVTINLAVSGFSNETKDVITKMIIDKMNSILG